VLNLACHRLLFLIFVEGDIGKIIKLVCNTVVDAAKARVSQVNQWKVAFYFLFKF
jgi:hypothetical protein